MSSEPVHIVKLTGRDLYISISNALVSLCPTPSQTVPATPCDETGFISIGGIGYIDDQYLETGSLVVEFQPADITTPLSLWL